jgi:hypothetical protein
VAIITLAVLTVVAVAAVSLSGRERVNANSFSRVDFMSECANAAQAKLWSEIAYGGPAYLGASIQITSVRLPDGTLLRSPAHYDSTTGTTLVKDVILKVQSNAGASNASANERDCTNNACGLSDFGSTQLVLAHCVDTAGRALEIELGIRFAL